LLKKVSKTSKINIIHSLLIQVQNVVLVSEDVNLSQGENQAFKTKQPPA